MSESTQKTRKKVRKSVQKYTKIYAYNFCQHYDTIASKKKMPANWPQGPQVYM